MGRINIQCKICNKQFSIIESKLKDRSCVYCSRECYNSSKNRPILKNCLVCNKEFYIKASESKKTGRGKYCSKKCYASVMVKIKTKRHCLYCDTEFFPRQNRIKLGIGWYCSVSCFNKSQTGRKLSLEQRIKITGENNKNWKGGLKESRKRKYLKQKQNLHYIISKRMSAGIRDALKNGGKNNNHWEKLVGYTFKQLKRRLSKTMPIGYTWDDFLNRKLHIDHIIPKNEFKYNNYQDLEFKKCWALYNLRLLPAKENILKGYKLIKSYQRVLPL